MNLTNTDASYGLITRLLHWCVASLIILLVALGWWMVGLSYYDRWYHDATQWHKALGMLALFIGSGKVLWTLLNRSVQFSAHLKHWERLAARSTHAVFLLMMVLIPSTGYLISTSAGDSIMIFECFEVCSSSVGLTK